MRYSGSLHQGRKRAGDFLLREKKKTFILTGIIVVVLAVVLSLALCGKKDYIQPAEIVIKSISASSMESSKFKPEFVADARADTAWSPARSQSGSGEYSWIKIYLKEPVEISGIRMINGIVDEENSLYDKFNRVKSVRVVLADYASYFWMLRDNESGFQTLSFSQGRVTDSVQLFVHSTYRGTHWDQLCIGEIIIY